MVCPACGGVMEPVVLACTGCELRLEGRFVGNEFARLKEEDLHFLRIFVHCEGRIRDMESALGVSYPTIKARLAGLKAALREKSGAKADVGEQKEKGVAAEVLKDLETGKISAEDAARALRGRGRASSSDKGTTVKKGDGL